MAMICGTPTPATIRVVQMEPGPMPTLTASAPASTSASAAAPVAMLPPMTSMSGITALDPPHALDHPLAVAMGGIDNNGIDPRLDQCGHPRFGSFAHAHGSADPQSTGGVPRGVGEVELLGDVLHRDQAACSSKASLTTSKRSRLVLVQQSLGLLGRSAFGNGDQALFRGS
jgi:hypothetical protein